MHLHRISYKYIAIVLALAMIFFIPLIGFLFTDPFPALLFIFILILTIPLLYFAFYLYKKRSKGIGYYFDDEGITIDMKGTKVYWHEVDDIQFQSSLLFLLKSTVIYPHYTYHKTICARRGKKLPTPAHSIDWLAIERPKIYHEQLMIHWEKWKKSQQPL